MVMPEMSQEMQMFLDRLIPCHLWLDQGGHVLHLGPTLQKLLPGFVSGAHFSEYLRIERPHHAQSFSDLKLCADRTLRFSLRGSERVQLTGQLIEAAPDHFLLHLRISASLPSAIREFGLDISDFTPADQSIDLLYLLEMQRLVQSLMDGLPDRLFAAQQHAAQEAASDPLTGLSNRRALTELMSAPAPSSGALGLILIDLDLFKPVNDLHGHQIGDKLLQNVAQTLRAACREQDLALRLGGDEFALVVRHVKSVEDLMKLARRVSAALSEPQDIEGRIIKIGASIGIAHSLSDPSLTLARLMAAADRALYRAKEAGRCGISCAETADYALTPPNPDE